MKLCVSAPPPYLMSHQYLQLLEAEEEKTPKASRGQRRGPYQPAEGPPRLPV